MTNETKLCQPTAVTSAFYLAMEQIAADIHVLAKTTGGVVRLLLGLWKSKSIGRWLCGPAAMDEIMQHATVRVRTATLKDGAYPRLPALLLTSLRPGPKLRCCERRAGGGGSSDLSAYRDAPHNLPVFP
eukprot:FR737713.1.p1 GENE.FR737713.1~~FR737713.1.p1  ORF type:complete len:129 (+),score=9.54 FR737713.1:400-786(+)